MIATTTSATISRFAEAWRVRDQREGDVADPHAEREAEALFRQYVVSVALLAIGVVTAAATAVRSPPSAASAIGAIIGALVFGYVLVLTELTAVPQTLQTIPALRSARLRRLRFAAAAIGTVETALPLILAVGVAVASM